MTHTTFARRRRKVMTLRQNIDNLNTILNPMHSLLIKLVATNGGWIVRNLLKLSVLAATAITSFLLAKGMDQHWATVIGTATAGAILYITEATLSWIARKYAVESDLTPIIAAIKARSADGLRVLMAGFALLSLTSCVGNRFLGLDAQQWEAVAINGGKQLGKEAPGVFLHAYAVEQSRPRTSAKQPVPVQPSAPLLLPSVQTTDVPEGERVGGWFSGLINLFQ